MGVYLRAKFEVSSIILTSFRQGGGDNFMPPLPPPQNEPLKGPPRLGLKTMKKFFISSKSSFLSRDIQIF